MTDKPKALQLADLLDSSFVNLDAVRVAAAELRRLHEVNQALVEALEDLLEMPEADGTFSMGKLRKGIKDIAKDALTKAKETT